MALDPAGRERALGAEVVVGDRDISDVDLPELALTPDGSDRPAPPLPAGDFPPGHIFRCSRFEAESSTAIQENPSKQVVVNGDLSHTFTLNDGSRFEISRIVRGRYSVTVNIFGVGSVCRRPLSFTKDAQSS